ncbi:MAG: hypothetical protein IJV06_02495 [Bacteroidaceae bacterium]|nr:hypothetical protein [Bacteroidaceae bacterium]
MKYKTIAICSMLHFMVDGLCACQLYLLAGVVPMEHLLGVFLTYNLLAFLTQPLTGLWADRVGQKHRLLLLANVLLMGAVLLGQTVWLMADGQPPAVVPLLVATLLGLGNSFFHVWGGMQTAVRTQNDIRSVGVFVSTGAFGLSVGMVFSSWLLLWVFCLLIGWLSADYVRRDRGLTETVRQWAAGPNGVLVHFGPVFLAVSIILLMLIVMGRSFLAGAFSADMSKGQLAVLAVGAVSMLGKMAGGWVARSMGWPGAALLMVVVGLVCYGCRQLDEAVVLLGLFAVNCTMPITLYLANVVLKGHEGLAFGLLAAALVPAYVWAFL